MYLGRSPTWVEDLDPVLINQWLTTLAAPETAPDAGADALMLLTLAMSLPLESDGLVEVLAWTSGPRSRGRRARRAEPGHWGPVALRRIPPQAWTVTARLDVLMPTEIATGQMDVLQRRIGVPVACGPGLRFFYRWEPTGVAVHRWREGEAGRRHSAPQPAAGPGR